MRILLIRVGRMGDMVMITPALRHLLELHPAARVDLLTSPEGSPVLRGFDARLEEILVYDRRRLAGGRERHRLRREILARGYDVVYCCENRPSYRELLEGLPGEHRFLTPPGPGIEHFARRALELVDPDGEIPDLGTRHLELPVCREAREWVNGRLRRRGIPDAMPLVGLHPTFSARSKVPWRGRRERRNKGWPVERWAELGRRLAEQGSVRVLMSLLPEDRRIGDAIAAASSGAVSAWYARPGFERYKANLARMTLMVSPDTGPMHLAAAVGTPLVALFSGKDPRDCGPYVPPERYRLLKAEDTAHPERGLAALEVETVLEACRQMLGCAEEEHAMGRRSRDECSR